ncbi:MAG: YwqG family protein [Sandaracinaceae bacterium]
MRIRAAEQFLETPSQALVDAFCVRWASPSSQCTCVRYDAATQDEDARYRAMGLNDDLNAAFTVAMKRLRAHPQGVAFVLAGYGNGGERSRTACLKGLPTTALVATLETFGKTEPARALEATKALLAALSASHEHRAPLEAWLAQMGAPSPKKTAKRSKKKSTPTGPLQSAMEGHGNLDAALAAALMADLPTRAKAKKLAERLLDRLALDDDAGASRTLEVAWAAHSNKGPRNPGPRTARIGLEQAVRHKDVDRMVVWLERLHAASAGTYRDVLRSDLLTAWALHPKVRPFLVPKLPASSKAMHDVLEAHLLPTLTLRAGRTLGIASPCSAVGRPWLSGPWPRDSKDVPMLFLAQLNFAELPPLPGFPDHGLVMLFVPNDNTLGLGFGSQKGEYTAVFVEETDADADPVYHADAHNFEDGYRSGPLTTKHTALTWSMHLQPPIPGDIRFEALEGADTLKPKAREQLHTKWKNPVGIGGNHRIGGYAEFVQGEDPRRGDTAHYVHLLSLDSYAPWGFMFGDGGLAHFFIDPDDLTACRFDRMLWFWDCA